jgi:pantoate--beta-alanine ligase
MGQKDYQQYLIVLDLIRQAALPVELVMCDIVREKDGLAMSSRNRRLQPGLRKKAPIIFKILQETKDKLHQMPLTQIKEWALEQLAIPGFRPEYFEIVDAENLQPIQSVNKDQSLIACTAVWAGEVRLIDNFFLQ